MTLRLAVASVIVGVGLLAAGLLAQESRPTFEVESVKPARSMDERRTEAIRVGGPVPIIFDLRVLPGGRFTATYVTLKMLIEYAFSVRGYQIDGGPAWLTTDYFDIAAVAPAGTPVEQIRPMLQTLLTERFGLSVRWETRQAPVHVLTVARADGRLGPRLTRTSAACEKELASRNGVSPASPLPNRLDDLTPSCGGTWMTTGRNGMQLLLGASEFERFVTIIAGAVGGPVIDRTALSGRFDIVLQYTPEGRTVERLGVDSTDQVPHPPIAAALQQQLGLKLAKETGPLPIIVVDAAAQPTAN